jgi:hypothetical protein
MRVYWNYLGMLSIIVIIERIDDCLSHSMDIGDRKRDKTIKSGVAIAECRKLDSYCVDIGRNIKDLRPSSSLFL